MVVNVPKVVTAEMGEETQDVPFEVNKFPEVPGDVNPVPPNPTPIVDALHVPDVIAPVILSEVPVAAPMTGVTKVGDVANTKFPVPVLSDIAASKLALVGVAKYVATPVPNPLTPVEIGKPVALVKVAELGVPNVGVTSVGLFDKTTLPDPVELVTPVPP